MAIAQRSLGRVCGAAGGEPSRVVAPKGATGMAILDPWAGGWCRRVLARLKPTPWQTSCHRESLCC